MGLLRRQPAGGRSSSTSDFADIGLRKESVRAEDFRESAGTSPYIYQGWRPATAGGGTSVSDSAAGQDQNHIGVVSCLTGVATTRAGMIWSSGASRATVFGSNQNLFIEYYVRLPILSGAEQYYVTVGYQATTAAGAPNDAVFFEYDSATSANWRARTANGGVRTTVDSGVAVVANQWIRLGLSKPAGGVAFTYLINGAAVATIATNIPAVAVDPVLSIEKIAGAAARELLGDYCFEHIVWTVPR